MKSLLKFIIAFLAVAGAVAIAAGVFGVRFEDANYWDHHGIFFLIGITLVPRLTLLLSSVATGGLLWWLSWLFAPRVLVAFLATLAYWHQNPILVVCAWLVAFGGESSEKYVIVQRRARRGPPPGSGPWMGRPDDDERRFESAKWVEPEK